MTVFKRKSRMLSLRLSEEEYLNLQKASLNNGARSVSDYARDLLLRSHSVSGASDLEARVNRLTFDLQNLNHDIQYLRQTVASESGSK